MPVCPAAGSLASYMVTRVETQKCSDFWIYLETGTSPQEHRTADGAPQPSGGLCVSPTALPGLGLVLPCCSSLPFLPHN